MKNLPIEIIIEFIKAIKDNGKKARIEYQSPNGEVFAINDCWYLLRQIIRQYSLSWDHYFVSKEAKDLWESLTDEPMGNYWGSDRVKITKDIVIHLDRYKGNSNKPFNSPDEVLRKGDSFRYREVFHDEHMVTVEDIMQELIYLDDINENNVINILNNIYICRMLKGQDKTLNKKVHRGSTDINEIKITTYKGIELISNYFK